MCSISEFRPSVLSNVTANNNKNLRNEWMFRITCCFLLTRTAALQNIATTITHATTTYTGQYSTNKTTSMSPLFRRRAILRWLLVVRHFLLRRWIALGRVALGWILRHCLVFLFYSAERNGWMKLGLYGFKIAVGTHSTLDSHCSRQTVPDTTTGLGRKETLVALHSETVTYFFLPHWCLERETSTRGPSCADIRVIRDFPKQTQSATDDGKSK